MEVHAQLIQLTVGYTLAGALVFTVIATCLSLVGWVKFADQAQQNKLFAVLIVELVVISVGFFGGLLKFDAKPIERRILEVEQYKTLSAGLNRYVFATEVLEEYLRKQLTTKGPMLSSVAEYNDAITGLRTNEASSMQLLQIHPDKNKAALFTEIMGLVDSIDEAVHKLNDEFEKVSVLGTQEKIAPERATGTAEEVKPLLIQLKSKTAQLLSFNES